MPPSSASARMSMRCCWHKGVPFLVTLPLAGLFTALCGAAIGRPTLRMSGLYLAIATLAFGSIVGTVFQKWTAVTGGFDGFAVPTPYVFGIADRGRDRDLLRFAAWCWRSCCGSRPTCCAPRPGGPWWRSATARSRRKAWASIWRGTRRWCSPISAGMTGLAGALFAHYVRYLAPDAFDVLLSVQFVTIVFVGGLGSLRGAILGAMFVRLLPQFIAIVRDDLPFGIGRLPGPGAVAVRPGAGAGDPVPAGRPERHVAEDEAVVPGVSVQAADQLSPAEILREVGAPAMILFQAEDISVRFGGIRAVDSVSFDVRAGRGVLHHRPERRRKDHDLQPDQPYLQLDIRQADLRGQGIHPHAGLADRRPGDRANLPEYRAVPERDPAAEPADRPALPFHGSASSRNSRSCPRSARPNSAIARRSRTSSPSSACSVTATR